MATSTGCQFTFEMDTKRPFCQIQNQDGLSMEAALSYGVFLQRYSAAALTRVGFSRVDFLEGEQISNPYSLGLYAKIFLFDNATGKRRVIFIPAPKPILFDAEQEVKLIYGQEAAQEFSYLTGTEYTFRHGALWGSTVP